MKRKQRRILLTSNILHIFGISILAPVYALYGLTVGANAWQIGASWAVYSFVAGISTIIIGRFIDGVKRDRLFIVVGYLITIIGIALFLFATNATQLYFIMAINAVGVGFYMPAWKALYTKAENKDKIASQWGVFDGTNMIAMAAAALLAGYLVNSGRYNLMFGVIILFYSIATIFVFQLKEKV
jgi:MFS family permease